MYPPATSLQQAFAFAFGACCGSFLNVLIARLPKGISIWTPPSHCLGCGSRVRAYDNVPIVSWLVLRGRCRDCGALFGAGHLVVEALSGLTALWLLRVFGLTWLSFFYFYLFAALLVASVIDWQHRIIPDELTYSGIGLGLLIAWLARPQSGLPLSSFAESIGGALLGGGALYLVAQFYEWVRRREGLGLGDVKLMAMLGALLGYKMVMPILLWSSLTGSVAGLFLILCSGKGRHDPIPFGPFLALGTALALLVNPLFFF